MTETYKMVITKAMSQDEQLQLELSAETKAGLADRLTGALDILDARLHEQGMRVVQAHQWVQGLPPEVLQAINAVMGVLFGRPGALQELTVAKEAIARQRSLAKPLDDATVDAVQAAQAGVTL